MSTPALPTPAPPERFALALRTLAPLRAIHAPMSFGIENIPESGPFLLAGNHTVYGLLDVPLMFAEIFERRGRLLRSLGDHAHFSIPGWRDVLMRYGAVRGTRENCAALMDAGEPILVFPGGGREVMKRKGEAYRLLWKERVGFARMAVAHGYPIVPFGAVGIEDAYDIHVDGDSPLMAPARAIAKRLTGRADMVPPIATGLGPTVLPRPERIYFGFGEPIATAGLGASDDADVLAALRDRVRDAVEAQIELLLAYRKTDPGRYPPGRIRRRLEDSLRALVDSARR